MQNRNHKLRPGFSLVELLAVVVIILVLLALLAPLMGQMKEQGRFVSCMSKLRRKHRGEIRAME